MKRNDHDNASDADEPSQPDESNDGLSKPISVREEDLKRRENAIA